MNKDKKIFTLGERRAEALKELCREENVIWKKSSYGGSRFGFKISKEWIITYNKLFKDEGLELSDYFQIICCSFIEKNIVEKIGLNNKHIKLLKRTYYYYDKIKKEDIIGILYLDFKRPFGNSCVMGDVLEEFDISRYDEKGDYIDKNWEEEYGYLLEETIQKIKDFFVYHPFDSNIQVEYKMLRFKPTAGYLRKHKIKKILKSEN